MPRVKGSTKTTRPALGWFRQAAANGFPVPAEYLTLAGVAALEKKAQGSRRKTAQASAPATTDRQSLVKDIQAGLAALGYNPGPADGLMGKKTANAIEAFQKDAGLPVDGKGVRRSDAAHRRKTGQITFQQISLKGRHPAHWYCPFFCVASAA